MPPVTSPGDAPRLVLHIEEDRLEEALIVGDGGVVVFAQASSIIDAVTVLLGVYYLGHLAYPRVYSQALGFLQHYMLGDPFVGPKSSKYRYRIVIRLLFDFFDIGYRTPQFMNLTSIV